MKEPNGMLYKIGRVIRWICAVFLGICLIITILAGTEVITLNYEILRRLYYVSLGVWFIAALTKFIPNRKKHQNRHS